MSSNSPSNTTTTQKFEPPDWTQGAWKDYLAQGTAQSQQPYQSYDGDRLAMPNATQQTGQQLYLDRAINGDPMGDAARQQVTRTLQGGYQNPYADQSVDVPFNPYADKGTMVGQNGLLGGAETYGYDFMNPVAGHDGNALGGAADSYGYGYFNPTMSGPGGGAQVSAANRANDYGTTWANPLTNQMMGMENPYFKDALQRSVNDIVGNFGMATMPGINSQATFNNAYGSSGHDLLTNQAQGALGKSLGNTISDAYMGEYRNQQGLQEADINRRLSAEQENLQRLSGLDEGYIQRAMSGASQDIGRAFQAGESGLDRMQADLQARRQLQEGQIGRNFSAGEAATDRSLSDLNAQRQLQEAAINRGVSAQQADYARNLGAYDTMIDRGLGQFNRNRDVNAGLWQQGYQNIMSAVPQWQSILAGDMGQYQNIIGMGDANQSQEQRALDMAYQDWLAARDYGRQQLDVYGNVLSRASGTGSTNTSQLSGGGGYQTPPWAPALAAALM